MRAWSAGVQYCLTNSGIPDPKGPAPINATQVAQATSDSGMKR